MNTTQNGSTASAAVKMFARPATVQAAARAVQPQDAATATTTGSDTSSFAYVGTTAEQNAAGRTPKQIIDSMLELSARIGEPVTLRLPITPAMATYMLSLNEENRKISPIKLEQYVDDMKSGRWKENGDGISIADKNLMNNGQHRCHAVEQSGVTIITNVTVGVERDARETNDINATRSPANMLQFAGFQNTSTLAAVARAVISYNKANGETMGRPGPISSARIVEEAKNDPDLPEAANFAKSNQRFISKVASGTVIGFTRYLTRRLDPAVSDAFFEGVFKGAIGTRGLDTNDPRYVARGRLQKIYDIKASSSAMESVEVLFRAWNAFRETRTLETIKVIGKLPTLR